MTGFLLFPFTFSEARTHLLLHRFYAHACNKWPNILVLLGFFADLRRRLTLFFFSSFPFSFSFFFFFLFSLLIDQTTHHPTIRCCNTRSWFFFSLNLFPHGQLACFMSFPSLLDGF
ncbi:hypothetical protein IWZ03DRAFT_373278 [Phyllosticta citriasiana]|uniref:Uncharacterized protein n=1 Tax=Phyllosticta citriasiana TaxID=595635 RepID=A0ABR1KSP8_9PEZI